MNAVSLEERLEATREQMTPALLRVSRFLVEHPERALMATAAEIAEEARTSNATVVRAVQILGYSGLPALRREIGERFSDRYDRRQTMEEAFARVHADPRSVLDSVLSDAVDLLAEMRSLVDHDEFLASVQLLSDAERVVVMGWGPAGAIADYAALGLSRLGCTAASETQSGFRLADALSRLRTGDVILLLAPLVHLQEIDVVLTRASTVGVRCILVTESLGEKLREKVERVLSMPSSLRFTAGEMLAPLVVLDAILLGIAASKPDRARSTWEIITELRRAFSTGSFTKPHLDMATEA